MLYLLLFIIEYARTLLLLLLLMSTEYVLDLFRLIHWPYFSICYYLHMIVFIFVFWFGFASISFYSRMILFACFYFYFSFYFSMYEAYVNVFTCGYNYVYDCLLPLWAWFSWMTDGCFTYYLGIDETYLDFIIN